MLKKDISFHTHGVQATKNAIPLSPGGKRTEKEK